MERWSTVDPKAELGISGLSRHGESLTHKTLDSDVELLRSNPIPPHGVPPPHPRPDLSNLSRHCNRHVATVETHNREAYPRTLPNPIKWDWPVNCVHVSIRGFDRVNSPSPIAAVPTKHKIVKLVDHDWMMIQCRSRLGMVGTNQVCGGASRASYSLTQTPLFILLFNLRRITSYYHHYNKVCTVLFTKKMSI